MVENPRFPHYCRILRKKNISPMEDEEGYSPLGDDDENSLGPKLTRTRMVTGLDDMLGVNDSLLMSNEEIASVVYEGECRSYELHTTSDRGEVITSYRGLALPLTQDDWTKLGVVPEEGDEIAVDRGAYREYGRVVDKNPANFHGTHLTWRYGRN